MTVPGLRAVSGAVAAGLVLVTVGIVVVSILGGTRGIPGPGTASLAAHLAAAVTAAALQHVADRRGGTLGTVCSVAVIVAAGAVLWTQWWR